MTADLARNRHPSSDPATEKMTVMRAHSALTEQCSVRPGPQVTSASSDQNARIERIK
jgi:hypothetical protein